MAKLEKGIIQIYTGNGKGKTSAAFGLALRALGRGLKVYVIQFIKGGFDYGELHIVDRFPDMTLKAFGRGRFITDSPPSQEDVQLADDAMSLAEQVVKKGEYDVVILDEVNVAVSLGLVKVERVLNLIKNKPRCVELVLTGRYAPKELVKAAQLVTEMREIKHPFSSGLPARKGIDF